MKFLARKNSSKLRIGIDLTDIIVDMGKGGIYHYIINLFSNLRDIDTENQYILFFNYLSNVHSTNCNEVMNLLEGKNMQVKLSRFPRRLRRRFHIPANFFIGNVDILHGPFDNVIPSFGCKKIMTIHDIRYFDIYPRLKEVVPELSQNSIDANSFEGWNEWMKGMKRRVYLAVQKADHIITISKYSQESLINLLNVDRSKIHTVYNGVSSLFEPIKDENSIQFVLDRYSLNRKYYIFVGHIDPFKNVLRMILESI